MLSLVSVLSSEMLFTSCSKDGGGGGGGGCSSVQCSATTQSGYRCSRITTNCNGRCWQHQ